MVSRRPDVAECVGDLSLHDQVGGQHHGAGSALSCIQGLGAHGRIHVNRSEPVFGPQAMQPVEIRGGVHARQLLAAHPWRVEMHEHVQQALGHQHVGDNIDAPGAFGM